jgi:hypothetical protein
MKETVLNRFKLSYYLIKINNRRIIYLLSKYLMMSLDHKNHEILLILQIKIKVRQTVRKNVSKKE